MATGSKIQASTDFIDPTQLRNDHPRHRSIQFTADGLSFSVLDLERNTYIGIREYSFNLTDRPDELWSRFEQLRDQDEWLQHDFKSSSVAWDLGVSMLIPDVFSTPATGKKLCHFVQPLPETDELYRDELPAVKAENIFSLPQSVRERLPNSKLVHGSTPFLEGVFRRYQNDPSARVLVEIGTRQFTLVALQDGRLQLFNRYPCQTPEDFIYYLLFAMEQLHLSPEEVPLTLYGSIVQPSALYDMAYKYVRHVDFGLRPDDFLYAPILDNLPAHYFYGLFQQYVCVS